ncbi:MAG: efflux RND transporter periplasmic adaptor subunit [Gammaproteobacteria bacterium]|nr:efflux RND transporter periplasmic adaptor subunit [Gammaproteobacteria bacterium]
MIDRIRKSARLGLACVGAALALAGCEPEPDSVVPLYDSAPVASRDIRVTVDASGVIEPEVTVEVKSKASGEILAVHADTGDVAEEGSLLVEVDKRTPRNQLAEAEASLVAARARRQIAQTQTERSEKLFGSGTLTQSEFEQTQLELANAVAQVVSAEVALENARIAMDDTDVRAPITGTIIERHVEPGAVISSPTQAVSDGTVLMKMANLDAVQVRTLVDETDIGKIEPGMKSVVTVAAYPNQPFHGEVLKIEPQAIVEQNVTMFAVLIRLDNRGGLLRPGMNAEVSIHVAEREDVTAVPTAALRAFSDIPATAAMLGIAEPELRQALDLEGGATVSIGGRAIELPGDTNTKTIEAVLEKARSGDELSAEERELLRAAMSRTAGGAGTSGGRGAASAPPGAMIPGALGQIAQGGGQSGGRSGNGLARSALADAAQYQFGGEYWVVALRDNRPAPQRVRTGLTDLEYSEVIAGLGPEDRVLLLPSTSLFEQQERLQQFISDRFSSGPFQQQQGRPGRP